MLFLFSHNVLVFFLRPMGGRSLSASTWQKEEIWQLWPALDSLAMNLIILCTWRHVSMAGMERGVIDEHGIQWMGIIGWGYSIVCLVCDFVSIKVLDFVKALL